ncbi:MAG: GTP cyclohydrolase II [Chloroflexi bacterium]|nr:MAG: GTP cyclohydrolase II [Chloroflexota bacterium]
MNLDANVQSDGANTSDDVVRVAEAALPTRFGQFRTVVFRVRGHSTEIAALLHDEGTKAAPLVRLHSECLTGDTFGSLRCDCGEQLDAALQLVAETRHGILLYLRQEGRGIGLANKVRAYALQDRGLDTVDANIALGLPVDGRDYKAAAAVLRFLGVSELRLLTNNPAKADALERHGLHVIELVSLAIRPNPNNAGYLATKVSRMGHLMQPRGGDEQAEPEPDPQ